MSRRGFLKGLAAGGLLLAVGSVSRSAQAETWGATGPLPRVPHDPLVWLAIAPDGTVTIVVHRSEMGQGSRSTLVAAVADELEADLARVRVVQAEGDEARYGSQNTDGSRSIRMDLTRLREVGAAARQMLIAAAARRWELPPDELLAIQHEVRHPPSGRHFDYGELAPEAFREPVPRAVKLKPMADLRVLGREGMPAFDLSDMLTGRAVYGADVVLPELVYAAIARPPVVGGRLSGCDTAAARRVPGVIAVETLPGASIPTGFKPLGGVAVLASNTWAAIQGRDALAPRWDDGPHQDYDSTAYQQELATLVAQPGRLVREQGNWETARREAARVLSATYHVPHLAQAPMEPLVATAHVTRDGCEIWAPTQHPQEARQTVASLLGLSVERVRVHVTLLGGGFGRKSKPDFIAEAAWLSRAIGRPVRVQWTREDDLRHGYYHAVSTQRIEAALDAQGRLQGLLHRTAFPSIASLFAPMFALRLLYDRPVDPELGMGFSDFPYAVPHLRLEAALAEPHVRIGWYRAVANLQHAFAVNSFLAELAAATRQDHRDLLLTLLGPDHRVEAPGWNYDGPAGQHPIDTARLRGVLDVVAREAGWGRDLPAGHGLGLAVHRSFLSYVAIALRVAISPKGQLHIPRVDVAIDCGFVANPDRVRAQLEGAVIMGLSNAMYGAITFAKGRASQANFHDYPVMRADAAPREIRTWLLPSEGPPGGVGEAGVPPVAPALCNAIFAATGHRVRELPLAQASLPFSLG
ncbi:MAG: molybdopterin cofactor-binding domain-containing protein [Candidatus Sericytochromatia bacterium]|nr:molybdopterin cofactor-binding domain-containing protein [Candidatus Sericytochromatia bacterium]